MARSEKQQLIDWLYRQDTKPGLQAFDTLLDRAAQDALGKSAIDSAGFVLRAASRSWNQVRAASETDIARGRSALLNSLDESRRHFQYETDRLAHGDYRQRIRGKRLEARPAVLREIDSFSDREFEALACVACQYIGASHVALTPKGNEGGVDFFAAIPNIASCHVFGGLGASLRIVGQSKMHGDKLQVPGMRDFCETLNDVRHLSPAMAQSVPSWFRTARGPIVGWVISHHGSQSGAISRAHQHGIILSESLDLAELLATSKRPDLTESCAARATQIGAAVRVVAQAAGNGEWVFKK